MSLMRPKNEVESTLSAAFTRGSSTTIDLDDASDFPDSGVVRIDDGSEWCLLKYSGKSTNSLTGLSDAEAVNVSSGGATYTWPIGTTVTLVQAADYIIELQEKPATPPWVDVTTFSGSDIGEKINNAIAAGHLFLYIPAGTHTFSTPISIDTSEVRLLGAGRHNTILSWTGGDGKAIELFNVERVLIENLSLEGQNKTGYGLYLNSARHCHIKALVVKEFDVALWITGGGGGSYFNIIERSYFGHSNVSGKVWDTSNNTGVNYNTFIGCSFNNSTKGLLTGSDKNSGGCKAESNAFINCNFSYNDDYGIGVFSYGTGNTFISCIAEGNTNYSFYFDSASGPQVYVLGGYYGQSSNNPDRFYINTAFFKTKNSLKIAHWTHWGSSPDAFLLLGSNNEGSVNTGKGYAVKLLVDGNEHKRNLRILEILQGGGTRELAKLQGDDPASNKTALLLLVNKDGAVSLEQVLVGDENSGGSGYRALVIPN